ncbi:Regulator of rDNA transcription protein 15 [Capsicum baccatum]|uniref:Regulator of rDNA transcription protein 15 n=1 Tax=Capsicum baccatum TaxID=33114 RepID=A0A2G2UYI1_CAPBA|nr:Regulator of rDNA transcription protein 15 [Capsicum baccatum]
MIGRADIEGSKSNVAMNAWLPQASYPCSNFSDTSSFEFRRSKGSLGHAFTVRIRTGNQNQTSFYPSVPHEISVLVELILGHLRYLLTDVPPQPNSPPDNVFRPDWPTERALGPKRGAVPPRPFRRGGLAKDTCPWGPRPLLRVGKRTAGAWIASSPNSDLEAFSHNPAHGSFAPLAIQPRAMTNCVNQRFLSYWVELLLRHFHQSKGSLGHAFTVCIRTGNQNQNSFYPSVPDEISVLFELMLGHLRYLLTDVPPQPNSPPDNVFRPDRPAERALGPKRGAVPRFRFTE